MRCAQAQVITVHRNKELAAYKIALVKGLFSCNSKSSRGKATITAHS